MALNQKKRVMDNFAKIIDEAFACMNWPLILQHYKDSELYQKKKSVSINAIKKDLRNLCMFVMENNISYFDQEQFVIIWNCNDTGSHLGCKLEILFVPVRACSYENEENYVEEPSESDQAEYEAICRMLDKAVKEEHYELAAVLRDRAKTLEKLIRVPAKR